MNYQELAEELIRLRERVPRTPMDQDRTQMMQGEHFILNYLYTHETPAHPKDLSQALMVSSARIASILKSLEKRELIIREKDPEDSRQILVSLTDTGKELIASRQKAFFDSTVRMLEMLGEEDAKNYIRIQKKLFDMSEDWR